MNAKHVVGFLLWGWLWGTGLQGMVMGAEQSNGKIRHDQHTSGHKEDASTIEPEVSTLGKLTKSPPEGATKLEPDIAREAHQGESREKLAVIIKVVQADYVPPGIKVRAQIDPKIFTAEVDQDDLARLQSDPQVISIGTAKPLPPLEK